MTKCIIKGCRKNTFHREMCIVHYKQYFMDLHDKTIKKIKDWVEGDL